eukprot:TRINITY_DN87323_c0_g1_i1.p1 TRINITY_DN87323_c0_g1~~TRINITY_DN87323_c0_g1_i1.p1  ORF type:complete len:103 (-),score=50.95 TRINITY_DN87323_c0_g1_i1:82-390(-)
MVSSEEERKYREAELSKGFDIVDTNHDGYLDADELTAVAKAFNSKADTAQEVKLIINRLDTNRDGRISRREWVDFLIELFQFMNREAFDKHCQELSSTLNKK